MLIVATNVTDILTKCLGQYIMSMKRYYGGIGVNIGKETELIEFKKSTSETKEGVISISSILNKHGKGVVYFGVKDNGDVIGQDIGKDTERKLSRDISDNIRPAIWYEVNTKHTDDGKSFIEVLFNGSNVPYSAYGRYYQRFSDEDRLISDAELERLFQEMYDLGHADGWAEGYLDGVSEMNFYNDVEEENRNHLDFNHF